jgi:NAD+ diphosphatase
MSMPESGPPPALARGSADRAAEERAVPGLLDTLRSDPASRVVVVHGDRAPVSGTRLATAVADEVPEAAEWAFLGRADDGAAVLLAALSGEEPAPFEASWRSLRAVGGDLDAGDAGRFVEALSLGRWLVDAPFCPACGTLTELRSAGWSRVCPSCGREHFPRTDPAVIVAVASATDPDRLLLGSNALWGGNRYSCFAGFVEAGESAEAAVARELSEECGIRVASLQYRASQAWPYPRSLMLGFWATAVDDAEARADGEEIAAVRWFTRDEIGEALARDAAPAAPGRPDFGDPAAAGDRDEIVLPGRASIAHRLIADWHAGAA